MSIATIESMDERRFPRWAIWVTVIVLMLLTLYGAWRIGLKRAIARELAAMKAEGYPTTLAELDAWYAYPPGKNAADEIVAALGRIKTPEQVFGKRQVDAGPWIAAGLIEGGGAAGSGPVFPDGPGGETADPTSLRACAKLIPYLSECENASTGDAYPAACVQLIDEYVDANHAVLADLMKAVENTAARYPVDMRQGMDATMFYLGNLRQAGMVLALQAIEAESGHDGELATDAILTQIALANSLKHEPIVISQLVRMSYTGMAVQSCQRAVLRVALSSEQLQRLQTAFESMNDPLAMQHAMVSEVVCAHSLYVRPGILSLADDPFMRYVDGFLGILDYSHLKSIQISRQYIAIATMPEQDQYVQAQNVEAEFERVKSHFWTRGLFVSPLARSFLIDLRTKASMQCAIAALAAQRWRLEHGAWPVSWAKLVPGYLDAEPVDPFTGKALMMKVDGGVLTVYSVGEDLTDNGGARVNGAGDEFEAGSDVPFVIRAPKGDDPR